MIFEFRLVLRVMKVYMTGITKSSPSREWATCGVVSETREEKVRVQEAGSGRTQVLWNWPDGLWFLIISDWWINKEEPLEWVNKDPRGGLRTSGLTSSGTRRCAWGASREVLTLNNARNILLFYFIKVYNSLHVSMIILLKRSVQFPIQYGNFS